MITCPYCNSYVDTPPSGTTRILCPRCGERFPYRDSDESNLASTQSVPEQNAPKPDPDVPMPRRFSNRRVVLCILGVMTVMALVGLSMSLETVSFRRENDRHITKEQVIGVPLVIKVVAGLWMAGLVLVVVGVSQRRAGETPNADKAAPNRRRWLFAGGLALAVLGIMLIVLSGPVRRRSSQLPNDVHSSTPTVRSLAPAQLEALRYLPADTNIVAGIHVAELLQAPANQALLEKLKLGSFDFSPERVQKLTGLEREDLDHVVIGVKLEEIPPRLIVIVRTRQRFDPEAVRMALHGVPTAEARRPNRFHFKLDQPAVEAEAWLLPDEHLLVFGLTRADLEAVPERPHDGVKHLSPALGKMLELRLDPEARIWLAGNVDHWDRTLLSKAQNAALVQKVRSFGVGLIPGKSAENPLQLRADVSCVDADGARAIAKYLTEHKPEGLELMLPDPQGDWVSMKAQIKPDEVTKLLTPKGQ